MALAEGDIAVIANAVRRRDLRARDVVEQALRQIDEYNPGLNAVVARRDEQAIADADLLDAAIDRGEDPGPLAGVPVLVKDYEHVAGMRTTNGSMLFADAPPKLTHSTVPARLTDAGSVIVGKTNLPEFATEGYTANLLFGITHNPWSLEYSPGGSSGGSAAAVASGMVPIATATDGGGSIRIPAAFCGLVGLKPTNGVIGRWPPPDWIDYSTEGPFATSVADLETLLRVESGPVPGDPGSVGGLVPATSRPVSALWVVDRFGSDGPLPPDIAGLFEDAVEGLGALLGLPPQRANRRDLFGEIDLDHDWYTTATVEHVSNLGRSWVEQSLDRMHPGARGFMEWGLRVEIDDYLAARRRRFQLIRAVDVLLEADAIVVSPTNGASGWLADGRLTADDEPGMLPAHVFNTPLQNITGHPALSLPAGRCANGVPFGISVTAAQHRDLDLIELARRWEQVNHWPQVAPGYRSLAAVLDLR